MATWTIDEPEKLTFDNVRRLRVRAVAGSVGARTISGTVTLDVTAPGAGDIRVTTVSGHVALLRREPEARESL